MQREEVKKTIDNFTTELKKSLLSLIIPIIEANVEQHSPPKESEEILFLRQHLEESQREYKLLQARYEKLNDEMNHSREIFETKRKEWQQIKDVLSKKGRLKTVLDSCDSPLWDFKAKSSRDASIETDDCSQTLEGETTTEEDVDETSLELTKLEDPLEIMADVIPSLQTADSGQHGETFLISKKRPAPLIVGSLHDGPVRKQAHAKGCTCCSRFYEAIDEMDSSRQQHIQNVSRHRNQIEISDTPPGFWDVAFTPNH